MPGSRRKARPAAGSAQVSRRSGRRALATPDIAFDGDAYALLFERSIVPMWIVGRDGFAILAANRSARQAYGYAPDELSHMTLPDLHHPADRSTVRARIPALLDVAADAAVAAGTWVHRTRSGTEIVVEVHVAPVTAAGQPAVLVCATDVTRREEADRSLRQSARRFQAMIERSSDAIALLDADGRTIYASSSTARVLDYSAHEMVGRNNFDRLHPDDVERMQELFRRVLAAPEATVSAEYRFRNRSGEWRWIEGMATNLLHEASVQAVVVNYRDISARKHAEAALNAALRERENVMQTVPDVLYTLDMNGRIVRWNRRVEEVTGLNGGAIAGRPAIEFFAAEDRPRVLAAIARAFETGFGEVEARMLDAAGEPVAYRYTGVPLRDGDNQIIGLTGVGHDISDWQRVEQQLAADAQVWNALADIGRQLISSVDQPTLLQRLSELTIAVFECDATHTVLWDAAADAYVAVSAAGYTSEEWEWLRLIKAPRHTVAAHIGVLQHEDVFQRARGASGASPWDGLVERLNLTCVLVMALRHGDELIGFHVACRRGDHRPFSAAHERIGRGLCQLASMALANSRLVDELARASRLKSEFVATMSHELRTPLNVIIGYTELLAEGTFGPLNTEQHDSLQRVWKSSRELLELINATLDLSRLEGGRAALDLAAVDVARLLAEISGETVELQGKPGVEFAWSVPSALPSMLTDSAKVKVIVKNLIGNAVKFTDAGRITVSAAARDDGVVFAVADTGIGIAPEALPIIFEPFRQLDSSATRRHGGVGLGLYIVRRLADLLGGTVELESAVGCGSTFRVWLPAASAQKSGAAAAP